MIHANNNTIEAIKIAYELVEREFNQVFRPGFKLLGSMNFADIHFPIRNSVEWQACERFYYLKVSDYYVTTNVDGYIVKLERSC